MNAAEFYALRDSRTNACTTSSSYANRSVAITVGPDAATSYSGQVAFLLAVNLTARWCRRIRVGQCAAAVDTRLARALGSSARRLDVLALESARAADPFGQFDVSARALADELTLHVGRIDARADAYCVRGVGWLALGGDAARRKSHSSTDADNPLGSAFSATIGAAWLFRNAIDDRGALPASVTLSLWNLRGGAAATNGPAVRGDLGRVALIGCGAVGSAIAWLASLTALSARWVLVDGDAVDVTNLNRSPLFNWSDIGRPKIEVVEALMRRAGQAAEGLPRWFREALETGAVFGDRPDVCVPAANDRGVRHDVQHQVPPLQVYGTTGRDWQAFLGRHIPLREDCLACRFPSAGPAAPPMACSTVRVPAPEPTAPAVDAALPFLSTAAATMAVAELAKAVDPTAYPMNANFACLDYRGRLEDFFVEQRSPSAGCICVQQRSIWARLNGPTRHARLSCASGPE